MIRNIRFNNFRNLENSTIPCMGQTTLVYGLNGSGKSNLLEVLFFLSYAQAMRPVQPAELIRWGEDHLFAGAEFPDHLIECGLRPGRKVIRHNQDRLKAGLLPRINPVVAFLPQDITIITGRPEDRRIFLDQSLMLSDPSYGEILRTYYRALRQRNAQFRIDPAQVSIWDQELIRWGSQLIEKRLLFVRSLNQELKEIYQLLYEEEVELRYLNTFKIEQDIQASFAAALRSKNRLEIQRSHTLVGPHRDNFLIQRQNRHSKVFASQGQTRALSIALKLGTLFYTFRQLERRPLILLDDVLLEIDRKRRELFLDRIAQGFSLVFTATEKNAVADRLQPDTILHVSEGRIQIESQPTGDEGDSVK